jgi:hypothetical protein
MTFQFRAWTVLGPAVCINGTVLGAVMPHAALSSFLRAATGRETSSS